MKAINCTQCGATIENVSERSLIIDCVYCGAKIMLQAAQPPRDPVLTDAPDFEIKSTETEEKTATLIKLTERYCVVYQTLVTANKIPVSVDMR